MFWSYKKSCKNGEQWVTPEQFQQKRVAARVSTKRWVLANPEKVHKASVERWATNRVYYQEKCKEWRQENPEKVNAFSAKRRASKLQRTPRWSMDNLGIQFEIECIYQYCTALRSIGLDYHVDHITPLQNPDVSGLHLPWNLRVIPAEDNLRKGNKYERDYTEEYH